MEWVSVLTTIGTLLFAIAGAAFTIDRTINGKLQRVLCVVERLEQRLDHLEKDEDRHRHAGGAYARQMRHTLAEHGIDAPDPGDFSGL